MPQNSIEGHELTIPFQPILAMFRQHKEKHADKIALYDLEQDTSITFQQIYDTCNQMAYYLESRGVGRGDKGVLLSDDSLEKLIIFMGLWSNGIVVVPLNVEMNQVYISRILRNLKPKITLWHEDLHGPILTEGVNGEIVKFTNWHADAQGDSKADEFFAQLASYPKAPEIPVEVDPFELGCIYCTSGTTAEPKLIAVHHMASWLFGLSTIENLALTGDDRTLEYRSFGWNSAQGLSLLPWIQTGCTMHIAKRFSHSRFFDWIKTHGITFSAGIPTVLSMLLDRPVEVKPEEVASLRYMTCSTAPLAPEKLKRFEELYGIQVLQFYGSSEAGWICGNRHYKNKIGTVGPPAKHQELEIVDADGNPCPQGVEGEVLVGGPQTYMASITPDGEWEYAPERIRTGDMAVMDEEGFVTVTGRVKDLIIRGGVNISPLEIDHVLAKYDQLLEAAVVGVPDEIYGEEVVCYVVPRSGAQVTENDVKQHCAGLLPDYRVPKEVYFVDELPKNNRGKVKRDLLQEKWLADHGGT